MKVFQSAKEAGTKLNNPAVTIGNFDGVHLGHQKLLARTVSLAKHESGAAVALTFAPHPARFFTPDLAPPLITTTQQKLALMERAGLDAVVIQRFDRAFAALTPSEFVEHLLVEDLRVRHVVVGRTFVFGRNRAGNLATLEALGHDKEFRAHGIAPVRTSGIVISSTKIREFLLMGRAQGARALLGRDYEITGTTVTGAGRGRTIGIPTANVQPDNEILPGRGVYVGSVRRADDTEHPAVVNVGTAPTVRHSHDMVVEAHLLDFNGDLLGERLQVRFAQRLRDEKRFHSIDELVAAIHTDIEHARRILREPADSVSGPFSPVGTDDRESP